MKKRMKKIIVRNIIIALLLICYAVIVITTSKSIPCFIHLLTGLQCPGCGISRMLISMLYGDFRTAFSFHPFLFITWPVLLTLLLNADYRYIKQGRADLSSSMNLVAITYVVLLLVFSIWRNL